MGSGKEKKESELLRRPKDYWRTLHIKAIKRVSNSNNIKEKMKDIVEVVEKLDMRGFGHK